MLDTDNPAVGPVSERTVLDACGECELPQLGIIEQLWETDPIPVEEIESRAAAAVDDLNFGDVPAGGTVAIGAGSRGIANVPDIVKGVVDGVRAKGYDPFVFPAMGSHGGATAEGQRAKLDALGVNEASVGCEIRATMDVVEVGTTPDRGVPVVVDALAAEADGILPVNRVKPHTDYQGDVESGLSKMLVIGMGKQRGAKTAHTWAVDWSFRNMIPEISSLLVEKLPVVGGVAVVEDQHDDTDIIEGVPPSDFLDREAELLEIADKKLPRLPFDELDVLVIDRMGKDVSGPGMDPNVIGRLVYGLNEPAPEQPDIKRIFVRSLTEASHGNAVGLGNADFIHQDLLAQMSYSKAVINALTASTPRGVRIPPAMETDRAGLVACLSTIGVVDAERVRVARIVDTMRVHRLYASAPLVEAARERDDLAVVREPEPVEFADGAFADSLYE